MSLVHHFLEDSARRQGEKLALICGNERLTYSAINDRAERVAAWLEDTGIRRQDRVIVFLDNCSESVVSLYGVSKAGGIFVMPDASMKARKLRFILKDSGAKVLITHPSKAQVVRDALADGTNLEHIVWCPEVPWEASRTAPHIQFRSWGEVLSTTYGPGSARLGKRCIDLDLAAIIYTSGSTGEPKGVMSAHANMVAAIRSITSYLENQASDIVLCALPLSFDYGLYQVLMAFAFGGTIVLERSFTYPYQVVERLIGEQVTGLPLVPTMVAMLLTMDLSRCDFTSVRYISNTAAALPVPHIQKLRAIFPCAKIFSMYGLTECKRVSYLPPEELDRRPNSVGIPIPNEEVFVVDENGVEVGPNVIGELVVRGSNVMRGYWNSLEESRQRFRPDPRTGETLLYTGDLFKRDEDGFLYFVARKDDLIKTKGHRVSPREIENVLCELDQVAEAAVIGVPDDVCGQAIKVFVDLKKDGQVAKEDILRHCGKHLESFMVPKYIEFVPVMPRTSSGKIDKKALAGIARE